MKNSPFDVQIPEKELRILLFPLPETQHSEVLDELEAIEGLPAATASLQRAIAANVRIWIDTYLFRKLRERLGDYFGRLLLHYQGTEAFQQYGERMALENWTPQAHKITGNYHTCAWFIIWFTMHYPNLAQVLLRPHRWERYQRFGGLSLVQVIRTVPKFVLQNFAKIESDPVQLDWVLLLAKGESLAEGPNLPFPLTKEMAKAVHQAPAASTLLEALIFGWLSGLGVDGPLYALLKPYFTEVEHVTPFGKQMVKFTLQHHQVLNDKDLELLLTFLEHCRTEMPDFEIKGRELAPILQQAKAWKAEGQKTILTSKATSTDQARKPHAVLQLKSRHWTFQGQY
ncbi:MAG: hypothetical protein KDC44_22530, partial [Phaeodactylibacter sp.]|nr:hypothetical protein [Phaeodactylibacter sp.]